MLYLAGVGTRDMAYTAERCRRWCSCPNVVGIKEGSWESRALRGEPAPGAARRAPCRGDGFRRRAPVHLLS